MLMDWGLAGGRISAHVLVADVIIESSHHAVGQILCALAQDTDLQNVAQLDQVINDALAVAMQAVHCASSASLQGVAPGALVLSGDMVLSISVITGIVAIACNCRLQTDACSQHKN